MVDFLDTDGLAGKGCAEVDLFAIQAKTAAAGNRDGAVVEGILRFRDAQIRAAGSGVDFGRAFHSESFMGSFVIEFLLEGVEFGLLLQEVGPRRPGGLLLQG